MAKHDKPIREKPKASVIMQERIMFAEVRRLLRLANPTDPLNYLYRLYTDKLLAEIKALKKNDPALDLSIESRTLMFEEISAEAKTLRDADQKNRNDEIVDQEQVKESSKNLKEELDVAFKAPYLIHDGDTEQTIPYQEIIMRELAEASALISIRTEILDRESAQPKRDRFQYVTDVNMPRRLGEYALKQKALVDFIAEQKAFESHDPHVLKQLQSLYVNFKNMLWQLRSMKRE